MYHEESDTPALARSTIVTDLGRIDYIFSDKTGTLTENVMRFKRASVDGLIFGAPIPSSSSPSPDNESEDNNITTKPFHPLRQLLIAGTNFNNNENNNDSKDTDEFDVTDGLESFDKTNNKDTENSQISSYYKLTFNAEMFLRVLSICHTVVVEKDHDHYNDPTKNSIATKTSTSKGEDGAPMGYTYQAESPDEGALVSAASLVYGYQLVSRDSKGIKLNRFGSPSILDQTKVISGLKSKMITPRQLACEVSKSAKKDNDNLANPANDEVWTILAVNKFDSDRKRMSILVRSPPKMGSIPILFCKGADSAMLGKGVCEGAEFLNDDAENNSIPLLSLNSKDNIELSIKNNNNKSIAQKETDREFTSLMGLQTHLGDFASEGLRTLVLGIRVLSEDDCSTWLNRFEAASTSICNRDDLLKEAASDIECGLHIVGATAIEDKLQEGVPEAIANLGKAGLKLWVLTGDKRETAIEIGYSTKVLMPHMQLIEIVDGPEDRVRLATAKEFMRLVKNGKLPHYQRSQLDSNAISSQEISKTITSNSAKIFNSSLDNKTDLKEQRRKVRDRADNILKLDKYHDDGMTSDDVFVDDDDNSEAPKVFTRAASARKAIEEHPEMFSEVESQNMSIA